MKTMLNIIFLFIISISAVFAGLSEEECIDTNIYVQEKSENCCNEVKYIKINSESGNEFKVYKQEKTVFIEDECCKFSKTYGDVIQISPQTKDFNTVTTDINPENKKEITLIEGSSRWAEIPPEKTPKKVSQMNQEIIKGEKKSFTQIIINFINDCFFL